MANIMTGMVPKALDSLPGPLQRVLGSTGLNVVSGTPHMGANALPAIASVDADSPNTVEVDDPQRFAQAPVQTLGHEAIHLWQNNLPPTVAAKIPSDSGNPYDIVKSGDAGIQALRSKGHTLSTVPRETAASIIQMYLAKGGTKAPKAVQSVYGPWVNDLATTRLSTIMPTQPGQKGINTTPRPPMPPVSTYQ